MPQGRKFIIESEITSLERAIDKCDSDHVIVTDMIKDLTNDKFGIEKERVDLLWMVIRRKDELREMGE